MKSLLSVALLMLSLFGSAALAFEGSAHINANGSITLIPIQRDCNQPQPKSAVPTSNCDSGTSGCPSGYHMATRYCCGGWHEGFYSCGEVCVANPSGATAPGGDHESRH